MEAITEQHYILDKLITADQAHRIVSYLQSILNWDHPKTNLSPDWRFEYVPPAPGNDVGLIRITYFSDSTNQLLYNADLNYDPPVICAEISKMEQSILVNYDT